MYQDGEAEDEGAEEALDPGASIVLTPALWFLRFSVCVMDISPAFHAYIRAQGGFESLKALRKFASEMSGGATVFSDSSFEEKEENMLIKVSKEVSGMVVYLNVLV